MRRFFVMGLIFTLSASLLAEQSDFDKLNDRALKEKMLLESGGLISNFYGASIILLPIGNNNYRILVRATEPVSPSETRPINKNISKQIVGYSKLPGGEKISYEHDDPELAKEYGVQSVSSYIVVIDPTIIHKLAYGKISSQEFYELINKGNSIPK